MKIEQKTELNIVVCQCILLTNDLSFHIRLGAICN